MTSKIYISNKLPDTNQVPSMVSCEAMLGFSLFFIDGSNLYHNLKASGIRPGSVNIASLVKYVAKKSGITNYKIIYFNSIPSILDGKEKYFHHLKFLEQIRRQGIEVNTRKLQRLSMKEQLRISREEIEHLGLCDTCKPIVESHYKSYIGEITLKEKGVDMMIAIEMIRHGIMLKDCSRIILISGDADFIPCMDLLKMNNIAISSACTAKGYSYELRNKHKWLILDKQEIIRECQ